jgi:hypothetical protein
MIRSMGCSFRLLCLTTEAQRALRKPVLAFSLQPKSGVLAVFKSS